jgi:Tfp pilus assembly protein FimT
MTRAVHNPLSRRAFSIIELTLIIAIIGIMASMALPRFSGSLMRGRADAAARRVSADIALAQNLARQASASRSIEFFIGSGTYRLPGVSDPDRPGTDYLVRLAQSPYEARLSEASFAGESVLTFDGYGVPDSAGTVVLQVGSEQRTLTVEAHSGRVTISEANVAPVN